MMGNKTLIRAAKSGDVSQIKEILFSSLNEYEITLPDNYSVSDIDAIGEELENDPIFVLVRNDTVIGFLILKPIGEDSIELKRLYLAATERGQGFGKLLLNYALNFAKEHHFRYIRLETTSKFKEAVSLYRKHGFHELAVAKKAVSHDLVFEKHLR
jgi:ribosomal protein S18 acetylase RimI-like enzyme